MKAYSKEDLEISLPDYITNTIEEKELVSAIENELSMNPDFKTEYEEMRKAMNFLSSASLEAPADAYFDNLPVRINQRLENESANYKESFWEKLSLFYKILLPAVSVILIIFVLYFIFVKDKKEVQITGQPKKESIEKNNIGNNIPGDKKENQIPMTDNSAIQKNDSALADKMNEQAVNNKVRIKKKTKTESKLNEPKSDAILESKGNESDLLIADNINNGPDDEFDEDEFFETDEDENELIEEQFMELTPEEQKEVLDNLVKSQI